MFKSTSLLIFISLLVKAYSFEFEIDIYQSNRNSLVKLLKQESKTSCVPGKTFGYDGSKIWVDHGCRGWFHVDGLKVHCESWNFKKAVCEPEAKEPRTSSFQPPSPPPRKDFVKLLKQVSKSPCIAAKTFGFCAKKNVLWVSSGCGGWFWVGTKENGTKLQCLSTSSRKSICRVPTPTDQEKHHRFFEPHMSFVDPMTMKRCLAKCSPMPNFLRRDSPLPAPVPFRDSPRFQQAPRPPMFPRQENPEEDRVMQQREPHSDYHHHHEDGPIKSFFKKIFDNHHHHRRDRRRRRSLDMISNQLQCLKEIKECSSVFELMEKKMDFIKSHVRPEIYYHSHHHDDDDDDDDHHRHHRHHHGKKYLIGGGISLFVLLLSLYLIKKCLCKRTKKDSDEVEVVAHKTLDEKKSIQPVVLNPACIIEGKPVVMVKDITLV